MFKALVDLITGGSQKREAHALNLLKQAEGRLRMAQEELDRKTREYEERIREGRFDLECEKRRNELKIDEEKNKLRDAMKKDLIESDLKRVKAETALETYEKMDTKEDRDHNRKMLEKAIDGLSKGINVIR